MNNCRRFLQAASVTVLILGGTALTQHTASAATDLQAAAAMARRGRARDSFCASQSRVPLNPRRFLIPIFYCKVI